MNRTPLLRDLNDYRALWLGGTTSLHRSHDANEEARIVEKFFQFVESTPHCFERSNLAGHITGSALVVSEDFKEVLLTLHAKLGMWLQLGGHADGNHLVHEVARTEVQEESGLANFWFHDWRSGNDQAPQKVRATTREIPLPFDLDAHWIPPNAKDQGHWHYDIRYVVVAPRHQAIAITPESHDLRWFSLDEARKVTNERSMHRQFDKIEAFGRKT